MTLEHHQNSKCSYRIYKIQPDGLQNNGFGQAKDTSNYFKIYWAKMIYL